MDIFEREEEFVFDDAPFEKAGVWFQAAEDLPYHLDSLLAYLRILADCVAFSVPFFYRTKEKASIANRSFRDQRTWFLAKRPDFDPAYTTVLQESKNRRSGSTSWLARTPREFGISTFTGLPLTN